MHLANLLVSLTLMVSNTALAWRPNWHHNKNHPRHDCLSKTDVDDILTNWVSLFEKKDPASIPDLVSETVTDDFTLTDESVNFLFSIQPSPTSAYPWEGPYVSSKETFIQSLTFEGSSTASPTFERIFVEFNCDSITFRWQFISTTLGPTSANPNK